MVNCNSKFYLFINNKIVVNMNNKADIFKGVAVKIIMPSFMSKP